ncbi:apolipoprotein C, partial [Acrasis kona]
KKPTIPQRKARTSLEDVVRISLDKAEPLQKITETTAPGYKKIVEKDAEDDQRRHVTNLVDKNLLKQKMPLKRMDIASESSSTTLVGQAPTTTSPDITSLVERIKDLEEWRKKVEGTMQQVKEEVKVEDVPKQVQNVLSVHEKKFRTALTTVHEPGMVAMSAIEFQDMFLFFKAGFIFAKYFETDDDEDLSTATTIVKKVFQKEQDKLKKQKEMLESYEHLTKLYQEAMCTQKGEATRVKQQLHAMKACLETAVKNGKGTPTIAVVDESAMEDAE